MRVNHFGFLSGLLGLRGQLGAVINLLSRTTKLHLRRCTALLTLGQLFTQLHSDQGGGKNYLQITAPGSKLASTLKPWLHLNSPLGNSPRGAYSLTVSSLPPADVPSTRYPRPAYFTPEIHFGIKLNRMHCKIVLY